MTNLNVKPKSHTGVRTCHECTYSSCIYLKTPMHSYAVMPSYVYCKQAKLVANALYADDCDEYEEKQ